MADKVQQPDSVALWNKIRSEARQLIENEPILAGFLHAMLLKHDQISRALSYILANKLGCEAMPAIAIREIIDESYLMTPAIISSAIADINAFYSRDPVVAFFSTPLLYFKGFQALQCYRVAHWLWQQQRRALALFMQSRIATVFNVDIHPAAAIGCGVMLDHATGIVIGETAIVEDDVSILQLVTLGGTGKESGDRHPKIREGVMIGAGATILGNIEIGKGVKIGAGSVVLASVPEHTTVVGIPAKVIGKPNCDKPALDMNQCL